MLNFKKFITEEKNLHMTHAEDAVIDGGVKGTRIVIMPIAGRKMTGEI